MKKSIFDKHTIFISTNTQQIQANNNISSNQNYDFGDLEKQGLSFNYINENEFTITIPVTVTLNPIIQGLVMHK